MGAIVGIALWALIPGFIARSKGRNFWGYYFLSFVISPLITIIITLCLSRINSSDYLDDDENRLIACKSCGYSARTFFDACPKCGSYAKEYVSNSESSKPKEDKILFCRKCGEELIDNSKFCRKCGTKIVKEQMHERNIVR